MRNKQIFLLVLVISFVFFVNFALAQDCTTDSDCPDTTTYGAWQCESFISDTYDYIMRTKSVTAYACSGGYCSYTTNDTTWETQDCVTGQICVDGACVDDGSSSGSCIDTDGGTDVTVLGTATDSVSSYTDFCIGNMHYEYYCNSDATGLAQSSSVDCGDYIGSDGIGMTCSGGVCVDTSTSSNETSTCSSAYPYLCYSESECSGVGGYWCSNVCQSYACTPAGECSSTTPWNCETESACTGISGTWCTDTYGNPYCQLGTCPVTGCVAGNAWSCYTESECIGVGAYWCGSTSKWCTDSPCVCSSSNKWNCYTETECTGAGGYWCGSYCQDSECTPCTVDNMWSCYTEADCSGVNGNWCTNVCPTCTPNCQSYECSVCSSSNVWSCYSESECTEASGNWCAGTYGGNDYCSSSDCPIYIKTDCEGAGKYWCTPERGGTGWCQDYSCPSYVCSANDPWYCYSESECVGVGAEWCSSYCQNECPTCSSSQVWNCYSKDECKNVGGNWCGSYCQDYTCPTCTSSETWNCYSEGDCTGAGGYWCDYSGGYSSCQSTSCPTCSATDTWSCYTETECSGVGGYWCQSGGMYAGSGWCANYECPTCTESNAYSCYTKEDCEGVGAYWCGSWCSNSICPTCTSSQPWSCYTESDCNNIGLGYWCGGVDNGYCNTYECPTCSSNNIWNCYTEEECLGASGLWCDTWCTESYRTCPVSTTKETAVVEEAPDECREVTGAGGVITFDCGEIPCPIVDISLEEEKKCQDHGGIYRTTKNSRGCMMFECDFDDEELNPWETKECPDDKSKETAIESCKGFGGNPKYTWENGCEIIKCKHEEEKRCVEIEDMNVKVVDNVEKKCIEKGQDVVEGFDPRGCPVLICAIEENYCKSVPTEAYANCADDGGEMIVHEEDGCVVFSECIKRSDEDVSLSVHEKLEEMPEIDVLLEIALSLENIKMKFTELGEKTEDIANYYAQRNDDNQHRFSRVSKMFYIGAEKVDGVKTDLKDKLDDLTIDDVEQIKLDIRRLWKVTLKDALFVMLSNSDEVIEMTEGGVKECEDDECFNNAFLMCQPATYIIDDDSGGEIKGLEGDVCVIEVIDSGMSMECKLEKFSEGLGDPQEDLLPYCEGSLKDAMATVGLEE